MVGSDLLVLRLDLNIILIDIYLSYIWIEVIERKGKENKGKEIISSFD